MVKLVMLKKTKKQKILSLQRRAKIQSTQSHSNHNEHSSGADQFRSDAKKSAIIITLIIALEIILYFGTII